MRLDRMAGPCGWQVEYGPISDRAVLCRLTVLGVVREDIGECDQGDPNQATSAAMQAFKRACAAFGMGRYLYSLPSVWCEYESGPAADQEPGSGGASDLRDGWAGDEMKRWRKGDHVRVLRHDVSPAMHVGDVGEVVKVLGLNPHGSMVFHPHAVEQVVIVDFGPDEDGPRGRDTWGYANTDLADAGAGLYRTIPDKERPPMTTKAARRVLGRAAHQRRTESQHQFLDAEPIWERDELAAEVRRLAASWGLKRKKAREEGLKGV